MFNSPTEEIKQRLNIVDVLGEYLQLKKAGGNHRANCPFHHEKTPSFMVSEEKQIWHCFGCGKGGDIFSFIQEIEGLEFPEALRLLASKANVTLTHQDPQLENQKTRLLDIMKAASQFYQSFLLDSPEAQDARAYIFEKRKLSTETVEDFKIGFAPEAWDKLNIFLLSKGFKPEDIFLAGLSIKKDKGAGYYDRFRGRIMFPISDLHGNIVGFTGRILKEDPEHPAGKYVNTPQTALYDKSRVIYALDKAKNQIKKMGYAILMEGQMDVLMAQQKGFKNVVAASGTALTEEQIQLLKRYSPNIILSFDMDAAGLAAAKRGIALALAQEMNIKVLTLPKQYKDPDECLKADIEAFKKSVQQAARIMDYFFSQELKDLTLSRIEDKKLAAQRLIPELALIADQVELSHYLQQLASLLNVTEEILRQKLEQYKQRNKRNNKVKSFNKAANSVTQVAKLEKKDRFAQLSEMILALALKQSADFKYFVDYLSPDYLTVPELALLYKNLITYYNQFGQLELTGFLKEYPDQQKIIDILSLLAEGKFSQLAEKELQAEIIETINLLEKKYLQTRIKALEQEMRQAEVLADNAKLQSLSAEFNLLTQKLAQLL